MSELVEALQKQRFVDKAPGYPFAQPGDIFFTRGTNTLGRLIRWVERSPGEKPSWANHVGGVISPGYLVPPAGRVSALAHASEALWKVEHHLWWNHHKENQGYAVAIFRPRQFTGNAGVDRVIANWKERHGNKYGWWRLFTFLGERLTGIPFTKAHFQEGRIVCSNHILLGLAEDNIYVSANGNDPHEIDPDEFMDYCSAHPEEFQFVGWAIVPGEVPA